MGQPLPPPPQRATGTPPSGDRANAVVQGTLTAQGDISLPFSFYGSFNVSIWGTLTATVETLNAARTINLSGLTQAIMGKGVGIQSTLLPRGATVKAPYTLQVSGITTAQLGGLSSAQVAALVAGTDAAAVISGMGVVPEATILLERSFDGGITWLPYTNSAGTPVQFIMGAAAIANPVSFTVTDPEVGVAYRLYLSVLASGPVVNYRISETGLSPLTLGPATG